MDNTKFTKGKWNIDNKNNVIDYLGDEIAICPEWRTTSKANALLISKAPEMLEMLNRINTTISMHGKIEVNTDLHYQLEKLIKEATELNI